MRRLSTELITPPTIARPLMPAGEAEPTKDWRGRWPQSRAEFAGLVEAYADRLVRHAFRQVSSLHDAEDIVQEVFARAVRQPHPVPTAVGPYLYRSVSNACIDFLRRRNRAAVYREEVGIEELLAHRQGPREAAQSAEELRNIDRLLGRLPAEQAEAVRLRVLDELKLNEIADVTGCSINTVCSRLRYGLQKLRSIVSQEQE